MRSPPTWHRVLAIGVQIVADQLFPPYRKSRVIWLTTFSVAASAAATDRVYWMDTVRQTALVADHRHHAGQYSQAMALMIIVSIKALPVWFGF